MTSSRECAESGKNEVGLRDDVFCSPVGGRRLTRPDQVIDDQSVIRLIRPDEALLPRHQETKNKNVCKLQHGEDNPTKHLEGK